MRGRSPAEHVALAAIGVALALLTGFALASSAPVSYDIFVHWSAHGLLTGRGLRIWPQTAFWSLPQVIVQAGVEATRLGDRAAKLLLVPLLAVAALAEYRLSRDVGASSTSAAVAAAALACSPLVLAMFAGGAPDAVYLTLFVCTAAAGLRWVKTGRGAGLAILVALLAFAQRQYGLGLPLAIGMGLVATSRTRNVAAREWLALGACLLGMAGLYGAMAATGNIDASGQSYVQALARPDAVRAFFGVALSPLMIALVAIPLGVPLALSASRRRTYLEILPAALCIAAMLLSLGVVSGWVRPPTNGAIFPGDWLTPIGLGPAHLPGDKPPPVPAAFACIEAASLFVLVAMVRRADAFTQGPGLASGVLLAVLAITQFPAIYTDYIQDRHFLPEIALALPVLAAAVSSNPRLRGLSPAVLAGAIAGCLGFELVFFAAGEQDFLAWSAAVAAAAPIALRIGGADNVDLGPARAPLVDIPAYDRDGRLTPPVADPTVGLEFAPRGDKRPGVDYTSVASGRIVIFCRDPCLAGATWASTSASGPAR